ALRGRPVQDAHALRGDARLLDRGALVLARRGRWLQGGHVRGQGRGRLLDLQVRGRDPPRPARTGDGVSGPDPHVHRGGAPRGGGRRGPTRPLRPADRRLPVLRTGRTVGEHDRFGGAHHPRPDGHRGVDAGREVTAPEPREGDARPPRTAVRAEARRATGRDRLRAPLAGGIGRALGEDPHLQLPAAPRHRPPDQADRTQPGRGARRGPARVHRRARRRGEAAAPPGADGRGRLLMPAAAAGRVREALEAASDAFAAAGVDTPRLDAELLLAEATGCDRAQLAAEPEASVDAGAARRFGSMVRRRVRREPVAYILGRKGFRHLDLAVDSRALIPRPETELLVEIALELDPRSVLDVGTGSGAVALAVADELPTVEVVATDTSERALELARENAARLALADRVRFE